MTHRQELHPSAARARARGPHARRLVLCVGQAALFLAGCAADTDSSPLSAEPALAVQGSERDVPAAFLPERSPNVLDCGRNEQTALNGNVLVEKELYGLDPMNRRLAESTELRRRSGLEIVRTCADARAFVQAEADVRATQEQASAMLEPEAVSSAQATDVGGGLKDKVYKGLLKGRRGSVGLWTFDPAVGDECFCSGQLVSSHTLVTAAHCFETSGLGTLLVTYDAPDGSGTYATSTYVAVAVHPDYVHGETQNDVAVVYAAAAWNHPAGNHFVGLRTNAPVTGNKYYVNGYGLLNVGYAEERIGSAPLTWNWMSGSGLYYLNDAPTDGRMCHGDSGSMAISAYKSSSFVTEGVLSNGDGLNVWCTDAGAKQRWVAIPPKVSWIESLVTATGATCTSHTDQGVSYDTCS